MSAGKDNMVIGARDFDEFLPETQALIIHTANGAGHIPESKIENPDIIRLARNLHKSEAIREAANLMLDGKPLFFSPIDFLTIIRNECLRPYHEETFLHLKRMEGIFKDIYCLWEAGKFNEVSQRITETKGAGFIPDAWLSQDSSASTLDLCGVPIPLEMWNEDAVLGNKNMMEFLPEAWLYLQWSFAFHDFCKMAYKVEFWDESGTFSKEQRKYLHPHARWFFFLGEMFAVPYEVTALAVLHHYLNHGYPDNGVVKANQHFLNKPKFIFMLGLLTTCDVYEALSATRSYRKSLPHEVAMRIMPKELLNIEPEFLTILEIVKEELFPHERVIRPIEQAA